jgi:drug/metabolite transporter (DMT)-like permease
MTGAGRSNGGLPPRLAPWAAFLAAPLFFSTNLVFGRSLADDIDPFLLALIRWLCVAILLTPFVLREAVTARTVLMAHPARLLALGFLGMWMAGAIVYLALHHTSAINANLIYTTSPLMIIVIEAVLFGRKTAVKEMLGVALAFTGVAIIILRGDVSALATLSFNPGDVLIALAALSWAAYSVLQREPGVKRLSNLALFGVIAWAGVLTLLPAVPVLAITGRLELPQADAWSRIAGLVFLSSLAAFSLFQFAVRHLGASTAGLSLYLMPVFGVALAWMMLGERLEGFHVAGIAAVVAGIALATIRTRSA